MAKKKKNPINVLGVKLCMEREMVGLSTQEVAIRLADFGITVRDIEAYENGYDLPTEQILVELANIYQTNSNELLMLRNDIQIARKGADNYQRKKYVGKTFWEVYGDAVVTLVKLLIFAMILFALIKYDTFGKLADLLFEDNTVEDENYIVEDEYLKMLNSNRGKGKDYLNETGKQSRRN